jgi:hypothetical protein
VCSLATTAGVGAALVGPHWAATHLLRWPLATAACSCCSLAAGCSLPAGLNLSPHCCRSMFGGSLFVFDLSNKLEAELKDSKQDPPISCMHLDDQTGYIWTGHKNGNVRCGGCGGGGGEKEGMESRWQMANSVLCCGATVWTATGNICIACMLSMVLWGWPVTDELATCVSCRIRRVWCKERREAICDALRVYNSPVSAITTDEHGFCWVASGGQASRAANAGLGQQQRGCWVASAGEGWLRRAGVGSIAGSRLPAATIGALCTLACGWNRHA